ncbi:MAG: SLC13 family permease [Gemmataceae bacterium]
MSIELAIVLILLAAAILMFAANRPRMDAVALIVLTLLPFVGTITWKEGALATGKPVVTMGQALAGFSDSNIVLIAALFVIGEGLVRTGVARQLGDWLLRSAGSSEVRLLGLLMLVVCGLGSMMSSTAVTAIFIPVALRISQTTGTSPGRLMMPLSIAALISGMTTLIATAPNLVVNSELIRHLREKGLADAEGFRFFSFTPFGVPVLVLGIVYVILVRRWLGADSAGPDASGSRRPSLADWVQQYDLAGREYRVGVTAGSPLAGKTLEELRLRDTSGANVVAVERDRALLQPTAKTKLLAGDILLVDLVARGVDADALLRQSGLELMPLSGAYFTDRSQEIGMAEVIVPADSDLIGRTVAESQFRGRTGLTAIGLRRGRAALDGGPQGRPLEVGDTLLVVGPWKAIGRLEPDHSGVLILRLPAEVEDVLPVAGKAPQAVACLALVVVLMISGVVPNVHAALIGCLLMGALGVTDMTSAYRSIDWKTIVLIVGMLPFSAALQNTGGVKLMADGLMAVVGGAGTYAVLASIFALTALLGLFISNTATAVLMAPVALAVADMRGASPYPFAMIVALAASTAFMTPVSSPVNTLVVTPGNYRFGDFVRIGVPFSLIVMVVSVLLVPLLLPL